MARKASFAPDRMSDLQLWGFVHSTICQLDPLDLGYDPRQTHYRAVKCRQALVELRLRGLQLALPLSEADDSPNQVA